MNADWTNIPIGAAVAALLIREASRFLHERRQEERDHGMEEDSGSRSVDFWESKFREIVYSELERHVLPRVNQISDKLSTIHDAVRELRWRKRNERDED